MSKSSELRFAPVTDYILTVNSNYSRVIRSRCSLLKERREQIALTAFFKRATQQMSFCLYIVAVSLTVYSITQYGCTLYSMSVNCIYVAYFSV